MRDKGMRSQKLWLQTFKACSCSLATVCQEAWRSSQCSTATSARLAERRWSRRTATLSLAVNIGNNGENGWEVRPWWQCSVHGVQEEILCVSSWLQKKPLKLCPIWTFFQRRGGKALVWWTRFDKHTHILWRKPIHRRQLASCNWSKFRKKMKRWRWGCPSCKANASVNIKQSRLKSSERQEKLQALLLRCPR